MKEYQGITQMQSQLQILQGKLGHYKVSNWKLQFEIDKEKYFNGLT